MMIIYGKEMCEFCDKAKEICRQYEIEFEYHSVDDRFDGVKNMSVLKNKLIKENRMVKTVPVIWHHNKFIGGYNELMSYIENTREYGQGGF
jgi:glutaredoxin